MIGAAELGILGLLFLMIWAAIKGLVEGIQYSRYQKEKENQERNQNNRR